MSVVLDRVSIFPSPEELAAARAGLELAMLDQVAKAEGRELRDEELADLAERVGEVAVDAAMHASLDLIRELGAGLDAQGACLRAMRRNAPEQLQ